MKINLEQITQSLPAANESYDWQGIKFDIYLAKNFFTQQWCDEALRLLVLKCRESFHRYGDVSVEDAYDNKSLVSVVGVSYLYQNRWVKEWVTIRLVPAYGAPYLSEDLQVEFNDHKKLFEIIKERLMSGNNDVEKRLFTVSRFCGISPYFKDDFQSVGGFKSLKYTLLSFLLLCKFSTKFIVLEDGHFYLTAMFHHNIFERLNSFEKDGKQVSFDLPNTHETLSIHQDELKSFFPGPVAFRHPTYFFKINEFVNWVRKMQLEEKIDTNALNLILKTEINWDKVKTDLVENKTKVVMRFAVIGDLLENENLKTSLLKEVPLSLILKLIHRSELDKKIDSFLKDLNFIDKYE